MSSPTLDASLALTTLKEEEAELLQKLEAVEQERERLLDSPSERIAPVQIGAALREPKDATDWIIPELLASRGVGLIAAAGGIGKSTLAAQLCATLAAGLPFCGFAARPPVATLYLQAEGSREKFIERIGIALHRLGLPPDDLPFFIQPRIWAPSLNGTMVDTIRACSAKLVILDTIGLFEPFEENSASDFKARILGPLRRLANQTGASFIIIHHEGKDSEFRKGRQRVRGTTAFIDDTDFSIQIEAPDGDKAPVRLLHFPKIRHGAPIQEPIVLEYDFSTASFALADPAAAQRLAEAKDDGKADQHEQDVKKAIARCLKVARTNPDGLSSKAFEEACGGNAKTHREARVRLADSADLIFEQRQAKGGGLIWKLGVNPVAAPPTRAVAIPVVPEATQEPEKPYEVRDGMDAESGT